MCFDVSLLVPSMYRYHLFQSFVGALLVFEWFLLRITVAAVSDTDAGKIL